MRFVTQTSVSVLLALCLVLLQRATMALPTQECSNSVDAAVTPCEADAKSPECCTAFGAIFSTYPTCLCDVIAEVFASDPNYQLNRTKLREIIVQCGLDVSASDTSCLPTLDGASPPTTPAPPAPAQNFEYPSPPPITRQSRSPPPPPDSSSTLLDSPHPPPEPRTSPSSIIGAVLRNGQYCISPNLNTAYYVVFALLGVLLY